MTEMQAQYEAYPYPARDPGDEAKRLITGSPSWPQEMDHWLWGGARDWSRPLRALVAGGGTGDGLIQLATLLHQAGRPYEITYLDLSVAAREVAEARAQARGLPDISFHTEGLLNASEFGPFDYIDCCGVLHHLPEPQEGFQALSDALAPAGGIGLMVYAPHGRAGVYPLQAAFGRVTQGLPPEEKLARAQEILARLPDGHPFARNPHMVDHRQSDAGFYDLLLHSSDRPYTITELSQALGAAGLALAGVPEPALYDPSDLAPGLEGLTDLQRMQLAEDLRGSMSTHIVYAVGKGAEAPKPKGPQRVPHLRGVDPERLAQVVAKKGALSITSTGGSRVQTPLPKTSAPLISPANGRRSLVEIAQATRLDPIAFGAAWGPVERALVPRGLMHYSRFLS